MNDAKTSEDSTSDHIERTDPGQVTEKTVPVSSSNGSAGNKQPIYLKPKVAWALAAAIILILLGLAMFLLDNRGRSQSDKQPANAHSEGTLVYTIQGSSPKWSSFDSPTEHDSTMFYNGVTPPPTTSSTGYTYSGQNIAYIGFEGIYLSVNGGRSFKNIYHLTNEPVTMLQFTVDNKHLVLATSPGVTGSMETGILTMIDLDGKNEKKLYTFSGNYSPFILSYNSDTGQLIYAQQCLGSCDWSINDLHVVDTVKGTDRAVVTVDSKSEIFNLGAVRPDGKKVIYYIGRNDPSLKPDSLAEWQGAPPYKVMEFDTDSGKSSLLATIGTLNEKAADGSYKIYDLAPGYIYGSNKPYIVADNKIYSLSGTNKVLLLNAQSQIDEAYLVSDNYQVVELDNTNKSEKDVLSKVYWFSPGTPKGSLILNIGEDGPDIIGVGAK